MLQGEVYGLRITEPAEGLLEALNDIKKNGIKLKIMSHKTKRPYKVPSYDMHEAAWKWLRVNNITGTFGLIQENEIFFMETKEEKIQLIHNEKCDYFIDDLEEILAKIKSPIKKFHYCQDDSETKLENAVKIKDWRELPSLLE